MDFTFTDKNQATPESVWQDHCLSAVRKFLKNAVVIDNEPFVQSEKDCQVGVNGGINAPADYGFGTASISVGGDSNPAEISLGVVDAVDDHRLNIREISDAFVDLGLTCAFVLPPEKLNNNDEEVVRRAVRSALISDVVVLDWYLSNSSPELTKEIIRKIVLSDVEENGRLRFICIYTGQPLIEAVGADALQILRDGGIEAEKVSENIYCSRSQSLLLMVVNKKAVKAGELPSLLVSNFVSMINGLLPAFAIAAVGAIRKNAHHMVTRFSRAIDSAFVANRLITNPPEDVAEMMRELLVAECDNALGFESVADSYLSKEAIEKWLNVRGSEFENQQIGKGKVVVDPRFVNLLLQNGIEDKGVRDEAGNIINFSLDNRNKVSVMLAGGEDVSKQAEANFSRLVVFKREAFGGTKLFGADNWLPSLTTGTLLKCTSGEASRYFLCLTPACDTLRLSKETPFVFLEAAQSQEHYSVILKDEDESFKGLYFRDKHPMLTTFSFLPDENTQRIRGELFSPANSKPTFIFSDVGGSHRFTWLGEIRYTRAASEMAKLAGNWMRIGVSDSEFLRLTEAKKFS